MADDLEPTPEPEAAPEAAPGPAAPGRRRWSTPTVLTVVGALLLVAIVATGLLARGEDDPYAAYCSEVEDRQQAIGAAVGEGGAATGLLRALPDLEAVAEKAPRDIRDEWQLVLGRLRGFSEALADAGVEPSTYDPEKPPKGLTESDQASIEVAANRLAAADAKEALAAVDQQVRDVCQTRLSL